MLLNAIRIMGYGAVVLLVALPLWYYPQLPASIPFHFNISGNPDSWGSKNLIFLLPAIAIGLFFVIRYLMRFPHLIIYPVTITEENKARQEKLAVFYVESVNTSVALLLLVLLYFQMQIALSLSEKLPLLLLLVGFIALLGPLFYYIYLAKKKA